jgi:hypothetical protein
VKFSGFRFPFLKRSPQTLGIVGEYSFEWESSEVISWPLPENITIGSLRRHDYQSILDTYHPLHCKSLPWMNNRLLEIPVSIPDDDVLAERLALPKQWISEIWLEILKKTRERGEIFVLQLHPERFILCRPALQEVIRQACTSQDVWIAPLNQVAEWWKKRLNVSWKLELKGNGIYELIPDKSCEVHIEIRNPGDGSIESRIIPQKEPLKIHSGRIPLVGVIPPVRKEVIDILKREGYLFEEKRHSRSYAVTVSGTLSSQQDSARLLQEISGSKGPLFCVSRWPKGYRSAFSVTGDIDGLDFWDYWTRFYGN